MAHLANVKQQYPDARHHCWAYLLGNPHSPSSAAMADDGEPSGTAGKPILNVLHHKAVDVLLDINVDINQPSGDGTTPLTDHLTIGLP